MNSLLAHRLPAPARRVIDGLALPLAERRRLVEACRAELAWAREDGLRVAAEFGLATDLHDRHDGGIGWETTCLPHEQAAARLLNVWGHLQPVEYRLGEALARLRARRRAGWDVMGTLEDIAWYRGERRKLLRAFLEAAADYRRERAKLGWIVSASGWLRQNARMVSNLWRRVS
jgi:hypothetical protein